MQFQLEGRYPDYLLNSPTKGKVVRLLTKNKRFFTMVNREIVDVVKKYLSELELKGLHISKAFIYGSQVNGTATSESDIDLMLVSTQFDFEYEEYLPFIWFSMIRSDNHIEPYIVGEKKFLTDDMSPIIGIVKQEGFEIAA